MCGGTIRSVGWCSRTEGLSPRVRGNPSHLSPIASRSRSIPACAGEPPLIPVTTSGLRVYPRVCGGTPPRHGIRNPPAGLSPRVRGNPDAECAGAGRCRSIPACAGEPGGVNTRGQSAAVYPRVCGGTFLTRPSLGTMSGLSPRVRGNPSGADLRIPDVGSIPACAGEPG